MLKDTSGKPDNEENAIVCQRNGISCYIMILNVAELCPTVVWKAELVNDQLGYLTDEISSKMLTMQLVFSFCFQ